MEFKKKSGVGCKMNMNNHERPKIAQKSHRANEDSAFDSRKIKKESSEVNCADGDVNKNSNVYDTTTGRTTTPNNSLINDDNSTPTSITTRERNSGSRLSNGFHPDIQDIIAAKLSNSNSHGLSLSAKNDKIRHLIEDSIRFVSSIKIIINF